MKTQKPPVTYQCAHTTPEPSICWNGPRRRRSISRRRAAECTSGSRGPVPPLAGRSRLATAAGETRWWRGYGKEIPWPDKGSRWEWFYWSRCRPSWRCTSTDTAPRSAFPPARAGAAPPRPSFNASHDATSTLEESLVEESRENAKSRPYENSPW